MDPAGLHLGKHGLFAKTFGGVAAGNAGGSIHTNLRGDGLLVVTRVKHAAGGLDSVAQLPEISDELIVPAQLEAATQYGLRRNECPYRRTLVLRSSSALRLGQPYRVGPGAATAVVYGVVWSQGHGQH
jgi:hypothetical protein